MTNTRTPPPAANFQADSGLDSGLESTAAAVDCDVDSAAISAERAHRLIAQTVTPVTQIERVAVRAAQGRVAAADLKSRLRVPNHTNSAMDGYALAGQDLPRHGGKKFRVLGAASAGHAFADAIGENQCVRIMTGAALPPGADSVVAQERIERRGDAITVPAGETPGANVRHAGEDLARGAVAIRAGQRLGAAHLGLAASLGVSELSVWRRPRVAFFSTGDELRAVGEPLAVGEVYDSNRYTLYGMLAESGVDMVDLGIVADDADAVAAAFSQAAACADLVITSAGASVGEADYIKQTLARLGEVVFWKVAIKPGRPLAFGRLFDSAGGAGGGRPSLFFGLPGNPVSVMATFEMFVKPALRRLAGETATAPLRLMATTQSALKKRPGRTEYQRGVLSADAAGASVRTTGEQGSGILSSMGAANCFILLAAECSGAAAGDRVEVQPLSLLC